MATVLRTDHDPRAGIPELAQRIDQIARDRRLLSIGELGRRVDGVRALALLNGMIPVARLAAGLSDALAGAGRGAMVADYCAAMRDLLAGDPRDPAAGDAFLAMVSVRLG